MPPQSKSEQGDTASVAAAVYPYATPVDLKEDEIQVDGTVYSAVALAHDHPGGELFVRAFAGRDATEAFLSYHRRSFPHEKVKSAVVGTLPARKQVGVDNEYLELCEIVNVVLRGNTFAPWTYWLKCVAILGTTFALELYVHTTGTYTAAMCGLIGLFYALIGLNVQHDANHGALSRSGWVNRIFGLTQNYIGASALDWIHQHVVQHHVNTNDVHEDPDIEGGDLLRLNPIKNMMEHQSMQHIYIFVLIGFFGFTTVVNAFLGLWHGVRYTPFSKLVNSYRFAELLSPAFFAFRWILLPAMSTNPGAALLATVPLYMVAGYYLAFFFILSHNYEGVHMYDKSQKPEGASFLRNQVLSSSNVGFSLLCFVNGGLNYQIEHHLFPRVNHTHYPRIAPIVKAYCDKKGIRYTHFPTVLENFLSCLRHLQKMSNDISEPLPGH